MRLTLYLSIILTITTLNVSYSFILIITGFITFLIYSSLEKETFESIKKNNKEIIQHLEDNDIKESKIKVLEEYSNCVLPTNHNPFMNFLLTDKGISAEYLFALAIS